MFNLVDRNSRSKRIAFALLLVVGCLSIIGHTSAAGSGGTDVHIELQIKDGMENMAIGVGLAILISVYVLIIFETVHRTLAAALGGLSAVIALNYFTVEAVWPGEDGSVVTVDEGFDPQRVQLTGNVVGQPPFQGTLQHHGWRAAQCDLPTLAASQDASIIAAAEVEL